ARDEYVRRRDELQGQLETLREKPLAGAPIQKQHELLSSLVDDWGLMTLDERRRLVSLIVPEIHAGADGIRRLRPHDDWKPYMRAALMADIAGARNSSERKTGLEPATPTLARSCSTN